jgi:ribose-phosphate pyrophosphokinase
VRDERGAGSVPAAVTHAVFSADAAEVIDGSPLVSLLVTDSVEGHPPTWPACYQVVSAAPLLTEAIRRVQRRDSISVLFEA